MLLSARQVPAPAQGAPEGSAGLRPWEHASARLRRAASSRRLATLAASPPNSRAPADRGRARARQDALAPARPRRCERCPRSATLASAAALRSGAVLAAAMPRQPRKHASSALALSLALLQPSWLVLPALPTSAERRCSQAGGYLPSPRPVARSHARGPSAGPSPPSAACSASWPPQCCPSLQRTRAWRNPRRRPAPRAPQPARPRRAAGSDGPRPRSRPPRRSRRS